MVCCCLRWAFGALLVLLTARGLPAADAAWNERGTELCLLHRERGVLVGSAPSSARPLELPAELRGKVLAVAHASAEGWLLLSERAVWRQSAGAKGFQRWVEAPSGLSWIDLAVEPVQGNLLLIGRVRGAGPADDPEGEHVARVFERKSARLQKLYARRLDSIVGPSFAPDGTLFPGWP